MGRVGEVGLGRYTDRVSFAPAAIIIGGQSTTRRGRALSRGEKSVSEDNAQSFDGFTSNDSNDDNSGARPNTQNRALVPVPSQPLHRMHEGRVVRTAGRMLVGSPVPVPTLEDILNETPVFSGRKSRRWRISSGTAVALACLIAVGSAIGLTGVLSKNRKANAAENKTTPQIAQRRTAPDDQGATPRIAQAAAYTTSNLVAKDVVGNSGAPVHLAISVANASPDEYSFLMIRGLPTSVTISAGFKMKDAWAVSLRDLEGLMLLTPLDYNGEFKLEVLLIKGKDQPTESRIFNVSIRGGEGGRSVAASSGAAPDAVPVVTGRGGGSVDTSARADTTPEAVGISAPRVTLVTPPEQPEPPQTAPTPVVKSVTPAEEGTMLDKAHRYLGNFDVASARLLFEHLARRGSAKGAMELAKTFDPAFFASGKIRGMKPNVEKAREWYQKAADLGIEEAATRLRTLARR